MSFVATVILLQNYPLGTGAVLPFPSVESAASAYAELCIARCESRKYDQHFILNGNAARIHSPMIDDNRMSLKEWTDRHNRWSDAEVQEILHPTSEGVIQGNLRGGTPMQAKRALRGLFLRVPLFARLFLFFLYRYFFRLGFLDGKPGLIYNVLQTFWYRFLIDAKLYEQSLLEHRKENL